MFFASEQECIELGKDCRWNSTVLEPNSLSFTALARHPLKVLTKGGKPDVQTLPAMNSGTAWHEINKSDSDKRG